jgi:2'-5' RNA ligase
MSESTYAVVSYLSGPIADFINSLRRSLNPMYADWLAHVSILPPRRLRWDRADTERRVEVLRRACQQAAPFEVELQGVSTFWPVNGVVYLNVSSGYSELVNLHALLNENGMRAEEAYGYVPHVTIAQSLDEGNTHRAMEQVMEAWSNLPKPVRFSVDSLVLVEQASAGEKWVDIAPFHLGSLALASQFHN